MAYGYEINDMAKEESWRLFRIMGELVEGFDTLSGIEPAISIYGSARIKANNQLYTQTVEIAKRLGELGFNIITGGGPGIMEAANKGAAEANVVSIGLNIELPEPQPFNTYANRSITFHHFFVRKVMLVKYATAFVIFPGGLGTLDELTEVLTLIQTHKMRPFPVILYDESYWSGFMQWLKDFSLARDMITPDDFDLVRIAATPDEVIETVQKWYIKQEIVGRKFLVPK
ncbi:MAG TPA: TIGR00730 family Rossman fold protein [Dehalococcoidia bacterium]|nr:TIGR00730 family Rossman fold protein [Dehalococcoidia bacterium]